MEFVNKNSYCVEKCNNKPLNYGRSTYKITKYNDVFYAQFFVARVLKMCQGDLTI